MTPLSNPRPLSDEDPQPPVGFITRKRHEAILRQVRARDAALLVAEMRERAADTVLIYNRKHGINNGIAAAILALPLPSDPLAAARELPEVKRMMEAATDLAAAAKGIARDVVTTAFVNRRVDELYAALAAMNGER